MVSNSKFSKRIQNKRDVAEKVLIAFKDEKTGSYYLQLTWPELLKRTGLPTATLNKYLIILGKENLVRKESKVLQRKNRDQWIEFYFLRDPLGGHIYPMREECPDEIVQFEPHKNVNPAMSGRPIEFREGVMRKPKTPQVKQLQKERLGKEQDKVFHRGKVFCRTGESGIVLDNDAVQMLQQAESLKQICRQKLKAKAKTLKEKQARRNSNEF